jgi:hypothetical protein
MDVPKDLKHKIDKRSKKDAEIAKSRKQESQARKGELEKIKKFRLKNKKKLMVSAKFAAKWLNDFFRNKPCKKAIKASYGMLSLFCSDEFYREVRLPKPSCGVHSEIIVYGDGSLIYREGYKFYGSSLTWDLGTVPIKPNNLYKKLHPEYLELFVKHLKSKEVWKYIKAQIKNK